MEKTPYYCTELDRSSKEIYPEAYKNIVEILNDSLLQDEINAGNITLAMIRPNVGPDANNLHLSDLAAAEKIEEMIQGLGVVAKFSFYFTKDTVEEFYEGGPQENMLKESPIDRDQFDTRWPEFVNFMCSAPTTAILLHSPNGDAIEKWRNHLGHWNIDEVRDETTIRGKLGVNKYNNLVHGSDAPESVSRELVIISNCIQDTSNEQKA
jgi:nucleoside diphosphate kinase